MSGPIVVAGGTGLLGRALRPHLEASGHPVIVVSRGPGGEPWEALPRLVEGAAAVVNLAGENLAAGRWTASRKARILASRVDATRLIAETIADASEPPPVLVQASAVGFYGPGGPEEVDETAPQGTGFLAEVCAQWEAEAFRAPTRVAILRFGVILASQGGALPRMALPVRLFAGVGLGPQGLSWIHIDDAVAMIHQAIRDSHWRGAWNACAPDPRSNDAFTLALARVLHRPVWPVPRAVSAGALRVCLGEMAQEMLLQGVFAQPARALGSGFTFRYSTLEAALTDLFPRV